MVNIKESNISPNVINSNRLYQMYWKKTVFTKHWQVVDLFVFSFFCGRYHASFSWHYDQICKKTFKTPRKPPSFQGKQTTKTTSFAFENPWDSPNRGSGGSCQTTRCQGRCLGERYATLRVPHTNMRHNPTLRACEFVNRLLLGLFALLIVGTFSFENHFVSTPNSWKKSAYLWPRSSHGFSRRLSIVPCPPPVIRCWNRCHLPISFPGKWTFLANVTGREFPVPPAFVTALMRNWYLQRAAHSGRFIFPWLTFVATNQNWGSQHHALVQIVNLLCEPQETIDFA